MRCRGWGRWWLVAAVWVTAADNPLTVACGQASSQDVRQNNFFRPGLQRSRKSSQIRFGFLRFPSEGSTEVTFTAKWTATGSDAEPPSWTLIIPADVTVSGSGDTNIGQVEIANIEVNDSSGSENGIIKAVVSSRTEFVGDNGTIPYTLYRIEGESTRTELTGNMPMVAEYDFSTDLSYSYPLMVTITPEDYNAAPNGTYTATITYTSQYYPEN